jgi:hypothetical protein
MVLCNPVFDFVVKLGSLVKDLLRFGLVRDVGERLVNRVSLSTTGLEIVSVFVGGLPQDEFRDIQRDPMMSDLAHDPITCTGYGHIRGLKGRVVGSRESPICRKAGNARVCEVASGPQRLPPKPTELSLSTRVVSLKKATVQSRH